MDVYIFYIGLTYLGLVVGTAAYRMLIEGESGSTAITPSFKFWNYWINKFK